MSVSVVCSSHFHIDKHFRHLCDWLTNCMCRSVCVSCNLPSFPLCAHISALIRYIFWVCVVFSLSVLLFRPFELATCIFTVNVVRQINCFFFFSRCALYRTSSHRHTHSERERCARLTVDWNRELTMAISHFSRVFSLCAAAVACAIFK